MALPSPPEAPARRLRIIRGPFERNIAVLLSATVLGQGLALLAAPVLTRLYSPEDFGAYAAFVAVLAVSLGVGSLCYDQAVHLPEDEASAANLIAVAIAALLGACALTGVAVWAFHDPIMRALAAPAIGPWLWLLPASLLLAGLHQIALSWSIRRRAFPVMARGKVTKGASQVGVQLGLGVALGGPIGLVAGEMAGRMAAGGTLALYAWREDRHLLDRVTAQAMREVAVRFRKFPFPTSASYLLKAFVLQVPAFVLLALFGPAVLGLYALGQRVIGVPLGLLGESVGQVYQSESARLMHEHPNQLPRLFRTTTFKLFAVGAPLITLLGVASPWLFGPIFGEGWREAGLYLVVMTPMFLAQFIATPLGFTLALLERHDLIVRRELLFPLPLGVAVLAAWSTSAGPYATVAMLSAANAIGYVVFAWMSWRAIRDHAAGLAAPARQGAPRHDEDLLA